MSKCCIHAKFLYGQVIRSGDIGFNIIFRPKISLFSTAVTLKLGQGRKIVIRFLACPRVASLQILIKIKLSVQKILCIYSSHMLTSVPTPTPTGSATKCNHPNPIFRLEYMNNHISYF